jgi:hypothetical protein
LEKYKKLRKEISIPNTSIKTENYALKNILFYSEYHRAITEKSLERLKCIFACKFSAAILGK